jgi:iodotyrosine deiodinase
MAVSNGFIPLNFERITPEEQFSRLEKYTKTMEKRRSVRSFSSRPVSEEVMEKVIQAAGTAPSGANQQPWTYVLIKDPAMKKSIRQAAEREEKELSCPCRGLAATIKSSA